MIITSADLRVALDLIERHLDEDRRYIAHMSAVGDDYDFHFNDLHSVVREVVASPHLLLPLGFDEFSVLSHDERPKVRELYGLSRDVAVFSQETFYRDRASGTWFMFEGFAPPSQLLLPPIVDGGLSIRELGRLMDERDRQLRDLGYPDGKIDVSSHLHFIGPPQDRARYIDLQAWIGSLESAIRAPSGEIHTLWLPSSWAPRAQQEHADALRASVQPLLAELYLNDRELTSIHWRELEEVVAELLRAQGLAIHLTPSTGDGGRDIVARGELIPGEPLEIAIEVKQKPIVGLADVQRALYANQGYPALLVATAGRFSTGVIQEKGEGQRLRLFLKDGIALSQWINAYGMRTWTT